eukprot:COSAG02_NODE_2448_length_8837_cov_38.266880_1_plen_124_part_10
MAAAAAAAAAVAAAVAAAAVPLLTLRQPVAAGTVAIPATGVAGRSVIVAEARGSLAQPWPQRLVRTAQLTNRALMEPGQAGLHPAVAGQVLRRVGSGRRPLVPEHSTAVAVADRLVRHQAVEE